MEKHLTECEIRSLLKRYHGFHDAKFIRLETLYPSGNRINIIGRLELLAFDHERRVTTSVVFHIREISELKICYSELLDYPNVRDDIAIKEFDGKVFFDVGFAAAEPVVPDDVRQSDMYFVGASISVEERTLCE